MDALNKAREGDSDDMDDAQQDIDQSALDVQVRDGWKSPGAESDGPEEFEILISTGGPASRIVGDLDEHGQVVNARFEFQDWFKPWTAAHLSDGENATILEWAQTFYFGE